MAIGRHENRDRPDQVRGRPQERTPLGARFSDARDIGVLEIADPTVDHAEGVRGRFSAKVLALDQRDGQTPRGCFPRKGNAENPAADHDHIEVVLGERLEVALDHDGTSMPWSDQERTMSSRSRSVDSPRTNMRYHISELHNNQSRFP